MELLKPSILEVSKTQLATDIEKVIAWNLKKLPRVKKFRKPVRTYILNKVKASADGMFLHPQPLTYGLLYRDY
jgi:hypothetical protein